MRNNMSCHDVESRLEAAHDGELLQADADDIATHLKSCTRCAARDHELRTLSDALHHAFPPRAAPAELRQRILTDMFSLAHASPTTRAPVGASDFLMSRPPPGRGWHVYVPRAASLVAMACVGWIASTEFHAHAAAVVPATPTTIHESSTSIDTVADELVASHVRSLLASHLTDVTSTDQHTVKPWFDGKLDYAPNVRDFATDGFPLLGGRLDFARGRTVAALVYGRHKHVINLFVWPALHREPNRVVARNGYWLRHWVSGAMSYWAVSDVAPEDLAKLQRLYDGGTTPQ